MYFIYGKLIELDKHKILIETNNIGYKGILVSKQQIFINNFYKLFIIKYKTDFLQEYLFFKDKRIRDLSEEILKIKNIGITTIFNIFSKYDYDQFIEIIKNHDFVKLYNDCKITQNNCKNIIVTLNKKVFKIAYSSKEMNVINGLQKLGYRISDIYKTLNIVDLTKNEEQMILDIIQHLNNASAK